MSIDFEADAGTGPSAEQLSQISQLAAQQTELEATVEQLKAQLKEAQTELDRIALGALPELMDACGVTSFTTTNGHSIAVEEKLYCSIPKKRMDEVAAWLTEQGAEHLIQNDVLLPFSRGEAEKAAAVIELLRANGLDDRYTVSHTVNTGSVKKLIKELREDGEDVPLSMLGAYYERRARISD